MNLVKVFFDEKLTELEAKEGDLLGDVITSADLPVEQPCAGRGTCGRCKVMVEKGATKPDEIEQQYLTSSELSVGTRLACRARISGETRIVLSPIEVYSNKVFKASSRHKREKEVPLGLAIDLGSTTVAAYLSLLDNGEVVAGGAALNQQRVYGADVISRLSAAKQSEDHRDRLHRLAIASIYQAIDSLKISKKVLERIEKVSIVGNVAMHHLLLKLPIETISVMPFQPFSNESIWHQQGLLDGIFDKNVKVMIPPLIGGFVGSDSLACLAFFDFDRTKVPMLAIDLGTNGEVMLTDGKTILTTSTAAGPAFEGVDISCGMRATDGAIIDAKLIGDQFHFETIGDEAPLGLTGSGLVKVVNELVRAGVVENSGRITDNPHKLENFIARINKGKRIYLTPEKNIWLSQKDIRELQKAKGAIRAAIEILMKQLALATDDLKKVILTGSFGGQLDVASVITLGMIPKVSAEIVENAPNGAGMGASLFLSKEEFIRGEKLARESEQVELNQSSDFHAAFIDALHFGTN